MNNLLIDDTDTLVQLLQEVSGDKKSSGNYRIVEVKESTTQLGTFLARRFLQYR